jgi:hypothetical protein
LPMRISMTISRLSSLVTKPNDKSLVRLPSVVMPILDQCISPIQRAVLVLLVTTVILKDTSRTTAGNSTPEKRNKDRSGTFMRRRGHANLALSGDNMDCGRRDQL